MTVILWSKYHCPYCEQAKNLLMSKDIPFEERKLDDGWRAAIPDAKSVPQIVIDDKVIGGFKNLVEYFEKEGHVN